MNRPLRLERSCVLKFWLSTAILTVLALLSASCADKIVSECDQQVIIPGDDGEVTFSEIQNEVLTPSCALAGCHSGQFAAASLDLSVGNAYKNLVNVKSQEAPSLMLVSPNNSGQSYIVKKLKGDNTTVMPPGSALADAVIEVVVTWIDNGAKDN